MERLTKVINACGKTVVVYTRGKYEDTTTGEMRHEDIRNVMRRLSDYEDTGLTPEQIRELKERDTAKAPEEHDGHWYKILEEIDETIERYGENPYIDGKVTDICYGLNIAKDIIRKHMNDGWIPVEERLPEVDADIEETIEDDDRHEYNVTIRGALESTTLQYSPDGVWFDDNGNVYDVIAWRPLPERYHPEPETEKPDCRQDMLRKFDRRE